MQPIPAERIHAFMRAENPWWNGPPRTDPRYRGLPRRAYFSRFSKLVEADIRRAVVLMGPRRVGKSVLMQQQIQKLLRRGIPPRSIAYLSLDQPIYANLAIHELVEHIRNASALKKQRLNFLFLDEIQYLGEWDRHLKIFVDMNPQTKCAVSGSAAVVLHTKRRESGAGRFTDFLLPPLTFHEHLQLQKLGHLVSFQQGQWKTRSIKTLNEHFIRYLDIGGYPEILFSESIRKNVENFTRTDIAEKVIQSDLPGFFDIQNSRELNALMLTLALNTAQEFSMETLCKISGVPKPTIVRYLKYLEDAFLIKVIDRMNPAPRRFKPASNFKVYLTNTALRSAFAGPTQPKDMGALVETAIFAQWLHANQTLHYARWKGGEVDMVHLDGLQKPLWCVEIKWSDSAVTSRQRRKPLIEFMQKHPKLDGAFTTLTKTGTLPLPEGRKLHYLPASLYCYAVGFNLVKNGSLPDWQARSHAWGKP